MVWRNFCAALAEFCCKKQSEHTIHVHTGQWPRIPANKKVIVCLRTQDKQVILSQKNSVSFAEENFRVRLWI